MPEYTERLKLPLPLGNEYVKREILNEIFKMIDKQTAILDEKGQIIAGQLPETLVIDISKLQKALEEHKKDGTAHDIGDKSKLRTKSKDTMVNAINSHVEDYVQHPAYAVASGTNAYAVTLDPAPTALVAGMGIVLKINSDATGNCTLNVNNLGAKSIVRPDGTPVNNFKAGAIYTLRFNGVNFIPQGEGGNAKVTNGLLKVGVNSEIVRFSDEKYLYTTKNTSAGANYRACKYDKTTGTLVKVLDFTSPSTGGNHHLTYTADGIFHRDSYQFPELRVYDENKTILRAINFNLTESLRQVQYGKDLNEFVFTTILGITLYDTTGTYIKTVYTEKEEYGYINDLTMYRSASGKIEAFIITGRNSGKFHGYFDTKGLTTTDNVSVRFTYLDERAMFTNHFNQYISSL
ncbi:hypothetical protein [Bacillus sp. AFS075034]|uniref:hypothetical protein n=1 Tax=Bacillus sp. AFS075034 TaxID=2034281 RepID=UPI000BF7BBA9|nr:hypothetical protein [Bacillus sp. AFS075034]PFW61559.1 hypothetical protein COL20_17100 [Bacillus sp. AFS075034]